MPQGQGVDASWARCAPYDASAAPTVSRPVNVMSMKKAHVRRRSSRNTRLVTGGRDPSAIMASSIRPSITPRPCSIRPPRTWSPTARRYQLRPPRHADLGSAGGRAARRSRASTAPASCCCPPAWRRSRPPCSQSPACRRPPAGDRQRLSADAQFLRQRAQALRRRDDLLRSADRRRHRRADASRTPGGVRRSAGLADLRDAGHAGHRRRRRMRTARCRADGQYLGDAAVSSARFEHGVDLVDPGRHQIYRRPFRRDARLRLGQRAAWPSAQGHRWRHGPVRRPGRHVPGAARPAHAGGAAGAPSASGARRRALARSSARRSRASCIRRSTAIPATPSGSAISPAPAACSAIVLQARAGQARCTPSSTRSTLFGIGLFLGRLREPCHPVRLHATTAPRRTGRRAGRRCASTSGWRTSTTSIADLERGLCALRRRRIDDGRAAQRRALRSPPARSRR